MKRSRFWSSRSLLHPRPISSPTTPQSQRDESRAPPAATQEARSIAALNLEHSPRHHEQLHGRLLSPAGGEPTRGLPPRPASPDSARTAAEGHNVSVASSPKVGKGGQAQPCPQGTEHTADALGGKLQEAPRMQALAAEAQSAKLQPLLEANQRLHDDALRLQRQYDKLELEYQATLARLREMERKVEVMKGLFRVFRCRDVTEERAKLRGIIRNLKVQLSELRREGKRRNRDAPQGCVHTPDLVQTTPSAEFWLTPPSMDKQLRDAKSETEKWRRRAYQLYSKLEGQARIEAVSLIKEPHYSTNRVPTGTYRHTQETLSEDPAPVSSWFPPPPPPSLQAQEQCQQHQHQHQQSPQEQRQQQQQPQQQQPQQHQQQQHQHQQQPQPHTSTQVSPQKLHSMYSATGAATPRHDSSQLRPHEPQTQPTRDSKMSVRSRTRSSLPPSVRIPETSENDEPSPPASPFRLSRTGEVSHSQPPEHAAAKVFTGDGGSTPGSPTSASPRSRGSLFPRGGRDTWLLNPQRGSWLYPARAVGGGGLPRRPSRSAPPPPEPKSSPSKPLPDTVSSSSKTINQILHPSHSSDSAATVPE